MTLKDTAREAFTASGAVRGEKVVSNAANLFAKPIDGHLGLGLGVLGTRLLRLEQVLGTRNERRSRLGFCLGGVRA